MLARRPASCEKPGRCCVLAKDASSFGSSRTASRQDPAHADLHDGLAAHASKLSSAVRQSPVALEEQALVHAVSEHAHASKQSPQLVQLMSFERRAALQLEVELSQSMHAWLNGPEAGEPVHVAIDPDCALEQPTAIASSRPPGIESIDKKRQRER